MKTLDEAWAWYNHNRQLLGMMQRLGDRYWADLPWEGRLGNDPANQPIISLIEEVNRVRRHRNWVAHGRKVAEKLDRVTPKDAYDILQAFWTHIRPPD